MTWRPCSLCSTSSHPTSSAGSALSCADPLARSVTTRPQRGREVHRNRRRKSSRLRVGEECAAAQRGRTDFPQPVRFASLTNLCSPRHLISVLTATLKLPTAPDLEQGKLLRGWLLVILSLLRWSAQLA